MLEYLRILVLAFKKPKAFTSRIVFVATVVGVASILFINFKSDPQYQKSPALKLLESATQPADALTVIKPKPSLLPIPKVTSMNAITNTVKFEEIHPAGREEWTRSFVEHLGVSIHPQLRDEFIARLFYVNKNSDVNPITVVEIFSKEKNLETEQKEALKNALIEAVKDTAHLRESR